MAKIDANLTRIATWLIEGRKPAQIVLAACRPSPEGLGLSLRGCVWLIERAKAEISAAGVWDRSAQRGLAITQLREMFAQEKKKGGDKKHALNIRKELTKLMDLTGSDSAAEATSAGELSASEAEQEIARVIGHLLPLKLLQQADPPASELARVAVQRIVELSNREPITTRSRS